MRTKLLLAASLLAVVGLLAGCGKTNSVNDPAAAPTASAAEQAKVASTLSSEPALVEDGLAESADVTSFDATPGAFAAIQPLRFWRTITDVQRSFQFAFSDTDSTGRPTRAVVVVNKLLTGTFNILTGVPGDSDSVTVIRKPLKDHWVRRILLKRVPGDGEDGRPEWRIVATSGVKVTSQNAATAIQSLRVQAPGLDTTLTDPLAFQFLRRIVRLNPGDQVTLTVTTLRNDNVVVTMIFGHRVRFHNNGDGTYTATWTVPTWMGGGDGAASFGVPVLHFGVNALSHGTLYDDTAPYDSQAWVLPFLIAPSELADLEP